MAYSSLEQQVRARATRNHLIGYALADQQLNILKCNTILSRWLEVSGSTLIGQGLLNAFPELVGLEDSLALLAAGREPGLTLSLVQRVIAGRERYFDLQLESGLPFGGEILLTMTDVTDQARLEQQLTQQRNELRLRIVEQERTEAALHRLREQLEAKVTERTAALALANDQLQVELSERKRAEEGIRQLNEGLEQRVAMRTAELEIKNRELEAFAYSVSHDLKAPLRGIDGYSRLLLEEYADKLDDEGQIFLYTIRQATTQMFQLIDDLLAYARLEQRTFAQGTINIPSLIEAVWAEQTKSPNLHPVTLSMQVPFTHLTADPEGITQALRNLVENALKFTANVNCPQIDIGGQEDESKWLLWVRDNGIGFDMQFHDRIFNMFQRLHQDDEYAGTGIGLAIVRKALQRMGGDVWAESRPGTGATFFLMVPKPQE